MIDPSTLATQAAAVAQMEQERAREATRLAGDLQQFTGTENYYRHMFGRLVFTDGVKYLAEQAGAFWLIDAIASYQAGPSKRRLDMVCEGRQFWLLKCRTDANGHRSATLYGCRDVKTDGTPEDVVVKQEIEFTDFPMDDFKLYCFEGGPGGAYVVLLPSEY